MSATALKESNATIAVGSGASFTLSGDDDTVLATGSGLTIQVFGAGNFVSIGGNPKADDDVVTLTAGGIVNELANSFLTVWGDNAFVNMVGGDSLELIGAADGAVLAGDGNRITVGQNGDNTAPT